MKRSYNRSNSKWICGKNKEGRPCHKGPNNRGQCEVSFECSPIKKGDHYHCARPPQFGGKCTEGPTSRGECCRKLPLCTPVRSLRNLRGILAICAVALSMAAITAQLGFTTAHDDFLSPGSLNSVHKTSEHSCSTCHSNAHGSLVDWLNAPKDPEQDSSKCLACHVFDDHGFAPHSLSEERLRKIAPSYNTEEKWACTTCHKEHRGKDGNIKMISNKQCQSCHEVKFDSFNNGHPEFDNYPFKRRTRIAFNHNSHFGNHFTKAGRKDISCQNCHQSEVQGNEMGLKGYEVSCKSCHDSAVRGKGVTQKGIVFLNLPTLDLDTLIAKKINIGEWPEDADGELTPIFKMLLTTSEDYSEYGDKIKNLDLGDLEEATEDELKAVAKFVWDLKKIMFYLIDEESGGLKDRIESYTGKKLGHLQAAGLLGNLSVDVIKNALGKWFPSLGEEISLFEDEKAPTTVKRPSSEKINEDDEDWMSFGGWYRSDEDFTIRYRPKGHADNFVRSWLNLSGENAQKKEAKAIFEMMRVTKSPGNCTKCHTIDQIKDEYKVNWSSNSQNKNEKEFVQFSHTVHFSVANKEKGCLSCHDFNDKSEFAKSVGTYDPYTFSSNFNNINKSTCVNCHGEQKVNSDCISCHNYHVGFSQSSQKRMDRMKTKME